MGVSSDLQRVIVARLKSAVPSVAGRVYGRRAPEGATMPYISIGSFAGYDDDLDCIISGRIIAQVDIFASAYPDDREASDITDAVRLALRGWSDENAITMHPLRILMWDVSADPDPTAIHGFVRIEAEVEEDG